MPDQPNTDGAAPVSPSPAATPNQEPQKNIGQDGGGNNNNSVKTDGTPQTSSDLPTTAEFFKDLFGEDVTPQPDGTQGTPGDKPKEEDDQAKMKALEKQIEEFKELSDKFKPLSDLMSQDKNLNSFILALMSGKITLEGLLTRYSESQKMKTPAGGPASQGITPKESTLNDALQGFARKRQTEDNARHF